MQNWVLKIRCSSEVCALLPVDLLFESLVNLGFCARRWAGWTDTSTFGTRLGSLHLERKVLGRQTQSPAQSR
jgi:hypothetical protein